MPFSGRQATLHDRGGSTWAAVGGVLTLLLLTATPATANAGTAVRATGSHVTVCKVHKHDPRDEKTVQMPKRDVRKLLARSLSYLGPCAQYGESAPLGNGRLTAFSQTEGKAPVVIGLLAKDSTYDGLPYDPPTGGIWCYDKDGNGSVDPHRECTGGHERALHLSRAFKKKVDSPFTYVLANWNPMGHIPPGVWDEPHFDIHFYMNDNRERLAIRPGPCPQLTHCDDYPKGKILPAAKYRHPDYVDVDAVEPGMGNHLIDPTAPEFHGADFTSSFVYGIWDGKVTFYEPMVNLTQYNGLRNGTIKDYCVPIKPPKAYERQGWYPTRYCVRHRDNRGETVTSVEKFVYRNAG
jgi:hypothetical protein